MLVRILLDSIMQYTCLGSMTYPGLDDVSIIDSIRLYLSYKKTYPSIKQMYHTLVGSLTCIPLDTKIYTIIF